jgi:hypothetical protein
MGKVLKAVAFIAVAGAMIASGGTLGVIGKTLLINGALSLASRLLMGKRKGFASPQEVMVRSSVAPRDIVIGLRRKTGVILFAKTAGANNEYLDYVIALAGHQVEDITDVWFDDVRINDADINDTTGVISGSSKFAGKALIFKYLGTSTQAASTLLDTTYSEWGSDHKLKGVAYLHVRFTFDAAVYQSGPPQNIFAMVKGARLYDPRLDSTNGGSGTHRYNDATTWGWSQSPALAAAFYITGGSRTFDVATPTADLGFGADPTRIDWPSVIAAANVCDETVTPVVYSDASQSRYLCDGVLSTGAALADNLDDILSSMAGHVVRSNGLYRVFAGDYETPAIALTEADVIGSLQVTTRSSRAEMYNAVKGTYFSSAVWQQTEFRSRENSTYATADGGQRWRDIDLPMTVNGYRAQRIAELVLHQSRNQIVAVGDFALTAFQVGLWDTLTLSVAELGWSSKVFRCIGWEFNPEGTIKLTLREESAAAYTDITGSHDSFGDYLPDYSTDSDPGTPASDSYSPALIQTSTAGNMTVVGASGSQVTLGAGSDGMVLMADASVAHKMKWGPASPATGDILTIGATSGLLERLGVGADGTVLTADSAEDKGIKWATPSAGGGGAGADPANEFVFYDDLTAAVPSSTSSKPWARAISGSPATVSDLTTDAAHPGIWRLETGTSSTGFAAVAHETDPSSEDLAGYVLDTDALTIEWLVRIPTLPDGTQTFELHLGLASIWTNSVTPARRALAIVRWNGSAVRWRVEARHAGTSSTSDASTGPSANTWHHVKLTCDSSQVSLDVDGTNVASVATNIPTTGATLGAMVTKSAGSTSRTVDLDLVRATKSFSTPRY